MIMFPIFNDFMIRLFFLALSLAMPLALSAQFTTPPAIGIVQNVENDSLLQTLGYNYLVENTTKLLSPLTVSDDNFQANLQKIKRAKTRLYACNIFLPGNLKVVGPSVNDKAILDYVEKVFQRAQQLGIGLIIWGSAGSRALPNDFDRLQARQQFVSIAKAIARVASRYNVTLALENLNKGETNFINTVREAIGIVQAVNEDNFKLCIDLYHMSKENESPEVIAEAVGLVVQCELAELEGRSPPGVHGDNFVPYFAALKQIGFSGKIVLECRWDDLAGQGRKAFEQIRSQLLKVY